MDAKSELAALAAMFSHDCQIQPGETEMRHKWRRQPLAELAGAELLTQNETKYETGAELEAQVLGRPWDGPAARSEPELLT